MNIFKWKLSNVRYVEFKISRSIEFLILRPLVFLGRVFYSPSKFFYRKRNLILVGTQSIWSIILNGNCLFYVSENEYFGNKKFFVLIQNINTLVMIHDTWIIRGILFILKYNYGIKKETKTTYTFRFSLQRKWMFNYLIFARTIFSKKKKKVAFRPKNAFDFFSIIVQ